MSIVEDFSQNSEKAVREIEELLNANDNEPQDSDLKFEEIKEDEKLRVKTSLEEPPTLELKQLPDHLEYAYLQGKSFHLSADEKTRLIEVLKVHKKAIAWKPLTYPGLILPFVHTKLSVQRQRRLNLNTQEVVKKEAIKVLDAGLIYPISDSP